MTCAAGNEVLVQQITNLERDFSSNPTILGNKKTLLNFVIFLQRVAPFSFI